MSFKAKTDWFGIATQANGIQVVSSDENKTAQVAQGHNEKGDIVAFEPFGETMSPSCSYVIGKDVTISALPKCGAPIAGTGDYS